MAPHAPPARAARAPPRRSRDPNAGSRLRARWPSVPEVQPRAAVVRPAPVRDAPFPSIDCLGVNVARLGWPDFLRWFLNRLAAPAPVRCSTLVLANAHTLNVACASPAARAAIRAATLVLNDGAGLDLYARLRAGGAFPYNFAGTDLVPRLLLECARRGYPLRVFLYGARPGRAAAAARRIEAEYAPVTVVGALDGHETSGADALRAIDAARPDLLLVGLGNPLQEEWLAAHGPALRARIAVGVGALFDFLSGSVPRAPRVLRAARLEWLFRLALEPRRLFRRYVLGVPLFLWRTFTYRPTPALPLPATPRPALPLSTERRPRAAQTQIGT